MEEIIDTTSLFSPEWNALLAGEKAQSLSKLGKQAREREEYSEANAFFEQSLNLCREMGDKPGMGQALIAQASLIGWVGADFSQRTVLANEALILFCEIGDKRGIASALCQIATLAPAEEATRLLQESLALYEEIDDKPGIARILSQLGSRANMAKDKTRARELAERAVALNREIGDKAALASALFTLSLAYEGDQRKACSEEVLALHREGGTPGAIYRALTMLTLMTGPDPRNESYLLEALEISKLRGDVMGESTCLEGLAEIARGQGDTVRAEALEAQAKATYQMPEMDPELEAAFESGDTSSVMTKIQAQFRGSDSK